MQDREQRARASSFFTAGLRGWAVLLAAAGCVLLGACAVYSAVFASLKTFTLGMSAAAFASAGACWLAARVVQRLNC